MNSIGIPTSKTRRTLRALGLYTEDTVLYDQDLILRRMLHERATLAFLRDLRVAALQQRDPFKKGNRL